jgi:hypothetical protein
MNSYTKAIAVTETALSMVGNGITNLLNEPAQLARLVGTGVALAAGVYSAREGAKLARQRIAAILGRPSLIRETSRESQVLLVLFSNAEFS